MIHPDPRIDFCRWDEKPHAMAWGCVYFIQ